MSFQFSPSLLKEEGGVRGRSSAYGIKRQAKRGGWKKGITDASTSYTTFFLLEREGRRKMGPSKLSPSSMLLLLGTMLAVCVLYMRSI